MKRVNKNIGAKPKIKIELDIPEGYEIESLDKDEKEITCKRIVVPPMERIKTIDDILRDHGTNINDFERTYAVLERDEKAFILLKMLAKSLNGDWVADWDDSSQVKHFPTFIFADDGHLEFNGVEFEYESLYNKITYRDDKTAKYAATQFLGVYQRLYLG